MTKKRNRPTEEFKREAVRLMLSRGERTVGDVAQSIGVTEGDLHRWREKYGGSVRASASIPETPEQEVKRLRKEVERLRQEREILKKPPPSSRRRTREVRVHLSGEGSVLGEPAVLGA